LSIPLGASGGIGNAKQLVAALALGADGVNMGTRFIATKEAPVHQNVKDALVGASELDTTLIMRPLRNTERVLKNDAVNRILEKEKSLGADIKINDIMDEVAGVYPKIMSDGDMDSGAWSCGMVAGLIHDVPSCHDLISGMMKEADEIISTRLKAFAA
jgi:NAD(P)H-dependent flavin oxidoreductase YrpB (nitropropane dioxygenase family)